MEIIVFGNEESMIGDWLAALLLLLLAPAVIEGAGNNQFKQSNLDSKT